jgi:hypothetical protein
MKAASSLVNASSFEEGLSESVYYRSLPTEHLCFYLRCRGYFSLDHFTDGCRGCFSFDHFTDGRTPWTSDQLVARPLPNTGQHKHRINAYTYQTSMPCVGFEPTIPASEQAKTVHALRPVHITRARATAYTHYE